jgi:hypothetical protein
MFQHAIGINSSKPRDAVNKEYKKKPDSANKSHFSDVKNTGFEDKTSDEKQKPYFT